MRFSAFLASLVLACPAGAQVTVLLVDSTAPGPTHDGLTWATAILHPQDAIDNAGAMITDILVAEGTYKPLPTSRWQKLESCKDPMVIETRTASFILQPGDPALRGGYIGYNSGNPGSEDPLRPDGSFKQTILSGRIGVPGILDNSYHVVIIESPGGALPEVVIDGFKIVGGNANQPTALTGIWLTAVGGGVLSILADVLLENLTVRNNAALGGGGGICIQSRFDACNEYIPRSTTVRISRSMIRDNTANRGGGLHLTPTSAAVIGNTEFVENFADEMGGGIFLSSEFSSVMGYNLVLKDNALGPAPPGTTNGRGAAIMIRRDCSSTLTNCTIAFNQAVGLGGIPFGAVAIEESTSMVPTNIFNNCIFYFNSGSDLVVTNTGGMDREVIVTASDIETVSGLLHADSDFMSVDPLFANGQGGNLRLVATLFPPVFSPCIDAGLGALLPLDLVDVDEDGLTGEILDHDLDLKMRSAGLAPDMGAYESTTVGQQ